MNDQSFVIKNDLYVSAILPAFNLIFIFPDVEICTALKGRRNVFNIQISCNRLFIRGRMLLDHHLFTKNCDIKCAICIHFMIMIILQLSLDSSSVWLL